MKLSVQNVSMSFDDKKVLSHISLQVDSHEIVSVVGPSGVGKSTLFHIISGLLEPTSGDVFLDGKSVVGQTGHVSYMLQKDLLLPYKTIEENIALPLLLKGTKKKEAIVKARELLTSFGLETVNESYPSALSGGMRQRIALLRTYLFSANFILLDEPFSALDPFTKNEIHEWYLQAHQKLGLTTLFITHDIDEAIQLSDRIYVLGHSNQSEWASFSINKNGLTAEEFSVSPRFLDYKKQVMTEIGKK